jgi:hypothetical protein
LNRLYLLGFTNDLKGVVFSQRRGSKQAKFWLPADAKLVDALKKLEQARAKQASAERRSKSVHAAAASAERFRAEAPARPLPAVGRSQATTGMPASEIQQLLREGRSIKSVSEQAKVSPGWVERLAEPVLVERGGVVRMAQRAVMPRPRLGTSGLPLGEAVVRNLEERRATPETIEQIEDAWDAKASRDGGWRVTLRFNHRGKRMVAEWTFHKGKHEIHARNRLAASLGWWEPEDEDEEPLVETDDELEEPEGMPEPPPQPRRPVPKPRARRTPPRKRPSRKPAAGKKRPAGKKTMARSRSSGARKSAKRKSTSSRTRRR